MATMVSGSDCAVAWARGAIAIREHGSAISPLITEIDHPTVVDPQWWDQLSPRRVVASANTLHSVAEMVGPDELTIEGLPRANAYSKAWAKFDRCRARGIRLSTWRDTYFERLTRSDNGNRLDTIIDKMNSWNGRQVAAFYAHTTANDADGLRKMGSPCLQFVQFSQRQGNRVDMFVVYRNHDFFLKALGNYLGLGRLLAFVARETGQDAGTMTCFSINAYLEHQRATCALAQAVL